MAEDPTELEDKIGLPITKTSKKVVTYKDKIHYNHEEEMEKQAKALEYAEKMKADHNERKQFRDEYIKQRKEKHQQEIEEEKTRKEQWEEEHKNRILEWIEKSKQRREQYQ